MTFAIVSAETSERLGNGGIRRCAPVTVYV
ncbi:hypothetical protein STENM223S_07284 [Streptomyces tendae]